MTKEETKIELIKKVEQALELSQSISGEKYSDVAECLCDIVGLLTDSAKYNPQITEEKFHNQLSNQLYNLAEKESKKRWPIAARSLHNRMIHTALLSATLKASAGVHYIQPGSK